MKTEIVTKNLIRKCVYGRIWKLFGLFEHIIYYKISLTDQFHPK